MVMKVKDIINSQIDFSYAGDTKVTFIVKPSGTNNHYFHSETNFLSNNPEIAEMEVERWMICNARGNKCTFIIIVKRDEEYEVKKEKAWKELLNK